MSGRKIFTEGSTDDECSCGVGQGSGPGGILFAMLINALPLVFIFSQLLLLVDDTQSYLHGLLAQVNDVIDKLNVDAEALIDCSLSAGLKLNADKTKAIMLGSELLKTLLQNLGLEISSSLKWDVQVSDIVTRTNKSLCLMYSRYQNLPINIKKQIVSQFLFPHFDYACLSFIDLTKEQENILQKQLNKGV